jgi:hypothetical protein
MTIQIDVKPEIAIKLQSIAQAMGLSIADYLEKVIVGSPWPTNDHLEDSKETIGQRLKRKGLLGIIDSSLPPDPDSPPRRDALFEMIADKLKKQGITVS